MTSVVNISSTHRANRVSKDSYVRVKRGLYAGDLGKVMSVTNSGNKAIVLLVPRIDYAGLEMDDITRKQRRQLARKGKDRPPLKLFNREEVSAFADVKTR